MKLKGNQSAVMFLFAMLVIVLMFGMMYSMSSSSSREGLTISTRRPTYVPSRPTTPPSNMTVPPRPLPKNCNKVKLYLLEHNGSSTDPQKKNNHRRHPNYYNPDGTYNQTAKNCLNSSI